MPDNAANTIAIITALAALIGVAMQWWKSRNQPEKDRAETTQLITEAACGAVEALQAQIGGLKARIVSLEALQKVHTEEIARLRAQIAVLESENQKLASENQELRDRWRLSVRTRGL